MNDLYAPDKSRDTTLGGGRIRSIDTVANVLLTNADKLQSVPMSNTQYSHILSKRGNGQHRIQGQPAYVHSECGAAHCGESRAGKLGDDFYVVGTTRPLLSHTVRRYCSSPSISYLI